MIASSGKIRDRFTDSMFFKSLTPALISSMGLALADIADAIVVGQRMGEVGLAAISLALPIYMVINLFMHGLGGGGSIRYSRLLGEGKAEEAVCNFSMIMGTGAAVSVALAVLGNVFLSPILNILGTVPSDGAVFEVSRIYVWIIISGIPLFFISYILNYYLRNDDKQKLAGIGFTVGNICDIVLNIVFVLILNMGAAGAALSTVTGQAVAIAVYLAGLAENKGNLRFRFMWPDFPQVFTCFRVGLSTSVQYIFQMIFLLIANNMLMRTAGENGVAVFDLVQNVSYIVLYLYDGAAKASQPLISTFIGEHNEAGRRRTLKLGIFSGLAVGGLAALIIVIKPLWICGVFGITDSEAVELGCYALRVFCMGTVFAGVSMILESFYQASEQEKAAFWIATLRGVIILLPFTIFFAWLGIKAFWWLYPATELTALFLFFFWLKVNQTKQEDMAPVRVYSRTIEGLNSDIRLLTDEMEVFCERWEASAPQTFFVTMAAEEVALSIIKNGFFSVKNAYIQITLVSLENGEFELHIRDNALKFNPFAMETKRADWDEDYDMDAMGIYVIKNKAKNFFTDVIRALIPW